MVISVMWRKQGLRLQYIHTDSLTGPAQAYRRQKKKKKANE